MQPGSLPACPDMTRQGSFESYLRTSLTVFPAKAHFSFYMVSYYCSSWGFFIRQNLVFVACFKLSSNVTISALLQQC